MKKAQTNKKKCAGVVFCVGLIIFKGSRGLVCVMEASVVFPGHVLGVKVVIEMKKENVLEEEFDENLSAR